MLPFAALLFAVTPTLELALPSQDSIVVLVVAPGVAQSAAAPSALIRATAEALEPPTGLRVTSVEQAGLDVDRLLGCPLRRASGAGRGSATRRARLGADRRATCSCSACSGGAPGRPR